MKILRQKSSSKNMIDITCRNMETDSRDVITIMYRSIDLRTIKDKDERKRIKKIQEIVALKKKNRRKMTDYEIGEMFA